MAGDSMALLHLKIVWGYVLPQYLQGDRLKLVNMFDLAKALVLQNRSAYIHICSLPSWEIMHADLEELLNKRSEIMPRCPHERKYLLSNYDSKDWLIAKWV